jgi:TRAP transporter 4TM/12TM fusion protein
MPPRLLSIIIIVLRAAIIVTVAGWILDIPGRLQIGLFNEQILVTVLGISLALTFLSFPLRGRTGEEAVAEKVLKRETAAAGWIDLAFAAAALLCCFYVAIRYQSLIVELVARPAYGVALSTLIVLLVCEASRRVTGLALIIIVGVLCAHALFGYMLPETFASRPVALSRLMVYLAIDTNALLGGPLDIAVRIVTPFVVMGNVLSRCGGSDFFADLAGSLMGHFRGGSAKIAVVGSAFFGMMSGSAVANVASVGTITIPLMKRAGFSSEMAAAIEAVGSTGGQAAPPVMGAAAFLMAEYLQVPYGTVAIAAIIPALLFFVALLMQVDLESAKLGIKGQPRSSLPSFWRVLRDGWQFLVPFIVLIMGLLYWHMEAEVAAMWAIGVLLVLVMVVPNKGRRMPPLELLTIITGAGGAVVDIIAITAISGILIGAMSLTGVAFSLTQQLLTISGGSLALLLIITAIAAFILGLPLPTVGVYIILATLAAPALVQGGILPMQAHMFVLHHGILGMVTPPVALASFAAATIAQSDQWRTGWLSTRLSWCAYLQPFLYAYSPELIMQGSPAAILLRLTLSLLGIFMGTLTAVGYFQVRISPAFRVAYAGIAFLLLVQPHMFAAAIWLNGIGFVLAAAAIAWEATRGRTGRKIAAA